MKKEQGYLDLLLAFNKVKRFSVNVQQPHPAGRYLRLTWTPLFSHNEVETVTIKGRPFITKQFGKKDITYCTAEHERYCHLDLHNRSLVFRHNTKTQQFVALMQAATDYAGYCIMHGIQPSDKAMQAFMDSIKAMHGRQLLNASAARVNDNVPKESVFDAVQVGQGIDIKKYLDIANSGYRL